MRRRHPRLTVLAAFLAAIVLFVAIGHAGSHLGAPADAGLVCGICADPGVEAAPAGQVSHTLVAVSDAPLPSSADGSRPADLAHAPRGPPALLA